MGSLEKYFSDFSPYDDECELAVTASHLVTWEDMQWQALISEAWEYKASPLTQSVDIGFSQQFNQACIWTCSDRMPPSFYSSIYGKRQGRAKTAGLYQSRTLQCYPEID